MLKSDRHYKRDIRRKAQVAMGGDPRVKVMLSEAHQLYFVGEFQPALEMLLEAHALAPTLAGPMNSLAMVYERMGDIPQVSLLFMHILNYHSIILLSTT